MLILEIFAAARAAATKASCRSSWRSCSTCRRAWCGAGATSSASAAASAPRGGPGEAQIELDRRMIGERIKSVKEQLDKVKRQRSTQRRARERNQTFRVSLVGYTNAGKSTLFNALVKARGLRRRPAVRDARHHRRASCYLEDVERGRSSLSDTVGFIRDLPHKLVEAFQATLQEAADADLLLHVVDAASPDAGRADAPRCSGCSTRSAPATSPQVAGLQQDRPARRQRSGRARWRDMRRAPTGGVRVPRVFVSARQRRGHRRAAPRASREAVGSGRGRRLESPPTRPQLRPVRPTRRTTTARTRRDRHPSLRTHDDDRVDPAARPRRTP